VQRLPTNPKKCPSPIKLNKIKLNFIEHLIKQIKYQLTQIRVLQEKQNKNIKAKKATLCINAAKLVLFSLIELFHKR